MDEEPKISQAAVDLRVIMLEARLARLEAHFGLSEFPLQNAQIAEKKAPQKVAPQPPPLPPEATLKMPPVNAIATVEDTVDQREPEILDLPMELPQARLPLPMVVLPYARVVQRAPAAQAELEQAIGLKWAGRIGAIILVIGAGLGIKFAYDQGWFGGLPDSAKLVMMSIGGIALIGAGEWVYRTVNKVSAVGFFAAGVAVFFLASYAGFAFYALYARNTAFVLMAISTLIGAAVAKRGNLVSIAVLSLIGGNLAPVVLHGPSPDLNAFLVYLLMLQGVALVLAAWGGERKWWTLRSLSLGTNSLWMLSLILDPSPSAIISTKLIFLLASTGLYQAELILSGWRTKSIIAGEPILPMFDDPELASPGVLFSTLVIAFFTAAVLIVLQDSSNVVQGMWVLGIAAVCAMLGFLLPQRDGSALRSLSIGYRVQAATLLVVAVPVWLSGISIEAGWVALAMAFAISAWALDLRIARFAAVMTWGLAAGHWVNRWGTSGNQIPRSKLMAGFPTDLAIAEFIAIAGHGVSVLVDQSRRGFIAVDRLRWVPTVGATVLWIFASVVMLTTIDATFSLVIYAWILFVGDTWTNRLGAAVQAIVVLSAATVKWVFVDLLADRLSVHWAAAERTAVFNPAMAAGILICLSLVAIFWWRREVLVSTLHRLGFREGDQREVTLILASLVIGLMTIGISFEIDRGIERAMLTRGITPWPAGQFKQLAFTMLWSLAASAQLIFAAYIEPSPFGRRLWLSRISWIPMALSAKFLLLDSLLFRVSFGVAHAMIFFNLQAITAMVVVGALATICYIAAECKVKQSRRTAGLLIALILLCTGLIEIDRTFENLAASGAMASTHAYFAKQVAMSIFGAVYAILSVAAGFYFRSAPVRYLGLGVFGITLLKVVLIDLADTGQGYRVLSFLGLGILLLGTSVLYGKLSPKLLEGEAV